MNSIEDTAALAEALPRARKRIIFVIPALQVGGAEEIVRLLARAMMTQKHDVLVISFIDGAPMHQRLDDDNIPVLVMNSGRQGKRGLQRLACIWQSVGKLRRLFDHYHPDIVNTHLLGTELDVLLAARLAGVRNLVVTIHNTYPFFASHKISDLVKRWRIRLVYARFSAVIAVSEQVRDWAISHHVVDPASVIVVRNGIDLGVRRNVPNPVEMRITKGIPPEIFAFITVASLRPKKNHAMLLRAIARLPEGVKRSCIFLLVGDGEERTRLEALAEGLNLGGIVRFLGLRSDVPDLLAVSDAFVLSSYYEGLSIAQLEAMAAGLPVISTEVAGSTFLVQNGVSGLLVPQGDIQALADALAFCVQNPSTTREMGAAARNVVVGRFSAEKMARDTANLFSIVTGF